MRMPPLLADLIHARGCKLKCEKFLTLPAHMAAFYSLLCKAIKKQPAERSGPAVLAQREGFEPSCDCSQTDFEFYGLMAV